tara:strand:- start:1456 stop:1620 length:165 start_codon:yes stop_codon:yes gene_type:complete
MGFIKKGITIMKKKGVCTFFLLTKYIPFFKHYYFIANWEAEEHIMKVKKKNANR